MNKIYQFKNNTLANGSDDGGDDGPDHMQIGRDEYDNVPSYLQAGGAIQHLFDGTSLILYINDNSVAELFSDQFVKEIEQYINIKDQAVAGNVYGFWYNNNYADVDQKCGLPYLGNFWGDGIVHDPQNLIINIDYKGYKGNYHFNNTENVFQFLKLICSLYTGGVVTAADFKNMENIDGDTAYRRIKTLNLTKGMFMVWDKYSLSIMWVALLMKFGYGTLRTKFSCPLLSTGNAYLGEYTPNNAIWAFNYTTPATPGENKLGRLIMGLRRSLGGFGEPIAPIGQNNELYYFRIIHGILPSWQVNFMPPYSLFLNPIPIMAIPAPIPAVKSVAAIVLGPKPTHKPAHKLGAVMAPVHKPVPISMPAPAFGVSYIPAQYVNPGIQIVIPPAIQAEITAILDTLRHQETKFNQIYKIIGITPAGGNHRYGVRLNKPMLSGYKQYLRGLRFDIFPGKDDTIFIR